MVSLYQFDGRVCLVITEETPDTAPAFSGPALRFRRGAHPWMWREGMRSLLEPGYAGSCKTQLTDRQYVAPGIYLLRWSFTCAICASLPYREWGFSLWWGMGSYVTLLSLSLATWQRRKHRLMKFPIGTP